MPYNQSRRSVVCAHRSMSNRQQFCKRLAAQKSNVGFVRLDGDDSAVDTALLAECSRQTGERPDVCAKIDNHSDVAQRAFDFANGIILKDIREGIQIAFSESGVEETKAPYRRAAQLPQNGRKAIGDPGQQPFPSVDPKPGGCARDAT